MMKCKHKGLLVFLAMSIFMLYAAALVNFHYNRIFSYQLIPNTVVCIRQKENQGDTVSVSNDISPDYDDVTLRALSIEKVFLSFAVLLQNDSPPYLFVSDIISVSPFRGPPCC